MEPNNEIDIGTVTVTPDDVDEPEQQLADVHVIVGGTRGTDEDGKFNPFGHASAAVDRNGIYSSGTGTPYGSSVTGYLSTQNDARNQTVISISTTPEQDDAFAAYFSQNGQQSAPMLSNNCADQVSAALAATLGINAGLLAKLQHRLRSHCRQQLPWGRLMRVLRAFLRIP